MAEWRWELVTDDLLDGLPPSTLGESAVTAVEFLIENDGYGSAITMLCHGDVPQPPDETRRRVRYRFGAVFGEALRLWVDPY